MSDVPAAPIDGLKLSPDIEGKHIKTPGQTLLCETAPSTLKFDNDYKVKERLSQGSFGTVYVTQHIPTGEEFAVKVIDRKRLSKKDNDAVSREVSVLKDCVDVQHIVRLVDFYVSPSTFYVVQMYARGGDVFERLATRASYTEKDARFLAVHLLEAMRVLHSRKMAHRDLKPENLLLRDVLDDSGILVADFGFARYVPEDKLKTRCGTPAFVAPEVLVPDCRYDESCDMWSVGCLLYMLLGGYPPFQDQNHRGLFRKIRGADYCFHDMYWKNVSVSAKQLISSLLTVDPRYRCTAKMALENSAWLKIKDTSLQSNDLSTSLSEIRKFQARHLLKGAMHAVRWSVKAKFKSVDEAGFSKQIKEWDVKDEANMKEGGQGDPFLTKNRPTLKFDEVYEIKEQIHKGRAAVIWECVRKLDGAELAVKVIKRQQGGGSKSVTGKSATETVLHEVTVLKSLKHKYILGIVDFFDEEDIFYLVMERLRGGDVFDRILQKKHYTEKHARDLAKFLIEAVAHMHRSGIAHRDLKPQNLLLKSQDDDSDIKIADFGFACRVHTPQSLTTRCGTPSYVAPEVLKNIPYDQAVDMWSVGVILFVILCGYPPFSDDIQSQLFTAIRTGDWQFNPRDWDVISEDAKELIRNLLVIDPLRRWTAKEGLHCKWLVKDGVNLSSTDLSRSLEKLKERKHSLRGVARTIMWMQKGQPAKVANTETTDEEALDRPETEEDVQHKILEVLSRPEEETGGSRSELV